jgi:two-component system, OmpR family, alkaline phosphatase synthesis response regulator PhoP
MAGDRTVLIIEDDREIADVIAMNLKDLGLESESARDGDTGLQKALSKEYALIILDLMLPGMDGLSLCRQIREKNSFTPVLILTAKSDEIDRVLGLEIGADDYMTKPFSVRELMARVKALLRRVRTDMEKAALSREKGNITYNGFSVDFDKRKVTLHGKTVDLTVKEFDLLTLFIRNPGRTYSRDDLLKLVWSYQYQGYEHTVNSHINRLRMKIEDDPGNPRYLKTVWGIGYKFAEIDELTP